MKVAVIGSGAWGTALAIRLCKNGHDVTMWTFEKHLIDEMTATRRNPRLPGAVLPENLAISGDYACASGCKLVVMASPSFPARSVCRGVKPYIDDDAVIVSVTKGLEDGTHMRMSEVVAQETDSLLSRAYHGSLGLMLSAMVGSKGLKKSDIDELYAILKKAEEDAQ